MGAYQTFDANTTAIEYLTSTGTLRLVGHQELRDAVLTYYNSVEDVAEIDALYRADAIASRSRWANELVRGEAGELAVEVWSQVAEPVMLRAAAAHALDSGTLRSNRGLVRLVSERHPALFAQSVSYSRLRREAAALLALLDVAVGPR